MRNKNIIRNKLLIYVEKFILLDVPKSEEKNKIKKFI